MAMRAAEYHAEGRLFLNQIWQKEKALNNANAVI